MPHKEEEYRHFGQQAMGEKKRGHEEMMRTFGISHLSTWLQTTSHGKFIMVYTECDINTPKDSPARLKQGADSPAWREIASDLSNHTGCKIDALSPDVEWLTKKG